MCVGIYIFLYSSVDELLACFHVPAIVNGASMNIGVHMSFQITVFLDICPRIELMDHIVALALVF